MCRLAAFNGGIAKADIIDILVDMQGTNGDGIGSCHIENGRFVINKFPIGLQKLLTSKKERGAFLSHIDKKHSGWTIIHMRGASPDMSVCKSNTHPWDVGDFAVCHNGFWKEHGMPRMILKRFCKFRGSTDSETAAHLINLVGPKKFSDSMEWGNGVFLALNRNGHLWAIKTSGDLVIAPLKGDKVFLSSELPHDSDFKNEEADRGWYHFDENGHYIKHKTKEWAYKKSSPSIAANSHCFSHVTPTSWMNTQSPAGQPKAKIRSYVPDGQPMAGHFGLDERWL